MERRGESYHKPECARTARGIDGRLIARLAAALRYTSVLEVLCVFAQSTEGLRLRGYAGVPKPWLNRRKEGAVLPTRAHSVMTSDSLFLEPLPLPVSCRVRKIVYNMRILKFNYRLSI